MKRCFVAVILIAGLLPLFSSASAKTMAEKWRDKRLPAIFAAWSIGPNHYFSYQNAADYALAAKHGLFYTNLDNLGFVFNTQYQGEGEVLTDASKAAAAEGRREGVSNCGTPHQTGGMCERNWVSVLIWQQWLLQDPINSSRR